MFIDSHCHLGFEKLGGHMDETLDVIKRAKNDDIGLILDIATDTKLFSQYLDFSIKIKDTDFYPRIYTSIGVHPLHLDENPNFQKEDIEKYLSHEKLIAIGETGFDGFYVENNFSKQREYFDIHAQIAIENDLPIIIHTRSAQEQSLDAISYYVKNGNLKGVIHCFTGNLDFAKKLLDLGFYLSFSGISTFKNATDIHEVIRYIPQDKILLETDAPYLAPVPHRGKTNEPAFVKYTYEHLAYLRAQDLAIVKAYVKDNFFKLFTKVSNI